MLNGIFSVLAACAVWGLIFVVPGFISGFGPLEIALGRYFFLGLISVTFILIQGRSKWRGMPLRLWRQAGLYALFVNIFYYSALLTGMHYCGAAVMALLMGLSPITAGFYGTWHHQEHAYAKLAGPSLFLAIGLGCVNWPAFSTLSIEATWEYGFGFFCGLSSLATWNWYMIANAEFLRKNPQVSSADWSSLVGAGTFFWVIVIALGALVLLPYDYWMKYTLWDGRLAYFLGGSAILGMVCSWLGCWLWNRGCQRLPISWASQLTIFETVFGVVLVYAVEQRFPTLLEGLGMGCILGGIGLSMHLLRHVGGLEAH